MEFAFVPTHLEMAQRHRSAVRHHLAMARKYRNTPRGRAAMESALFHKRMVRFSIDAHLDNLAKRDGIPTKEVAR